MTDDEVRQYISLDLDDDFKNKQFYKEVQYAQMISMSLKLA